MNFISDLFERILYLAYVTTVYPNVFFSLLLFVFIIYSSYKLKLQNILQSKYLYHYLIGLILFPIIILSCGIEASTHHLPFDANRSLFVKEAFFVNIFFGLNIVLVGYFVLKCKELRMFYISLGAMGLWISFLSWGLSLLFSLNNVFI